jgi:hypothetical protein
VADPPSVDDVSTADAAQLERWAFSRADVDAQRAEAALLELARRAEMARVEAEAASARVEAARAAEAEGADADDAEAVAAARAEHHHRRRMLATGVTGVVMAALTLVAAVVVIAQPEPEPLAIFGGPDAPQDREWADRITANVPGTITAGPRAIELGDGYVGVVTRISTVPDGRSTDWDSYCLSVAQGGTEKGGWALSTICTYPEKFEREGIVFPQRPSPTGEGIDTVTWAPTDAPRLARNMSLAVDAGRITSVLDWMAHPSAVDPDFSVESLLDEPAQLLMGPAFVPVSVAPADTDAFLDSELVTTAHLVSGLTPTSEPRLCVQVTAPDSSAASTCGLLSDARRGGLEVPMTTDGRTWIVTIEPDGPTRVDSVRLAD